MNKANQIFKTGQLIFILLIVSILATLFVEQTGMPLLFYLCVVIVALLSLCFLLVLLKTKKVVERLEEEVYYLKEREKANIVKSQTQTEDNRHTVEIFRIDEVFARIMPAESETFDNATAYSEKLLHNIANELNIVQGLIFALSDADQMFHVSGEYAYYAEERPRSFPLGETLSGQVAKNRKTLSLKEMPDGYITVLSGLGKGVPSHLVIAPIVFEDVCIGVIEIASFKPFDENREELIGKICDAMAIRLNQLRN